ncbi:MAG TPA: hypothetical protein VNT51_09820 [Miltoncostaeaceae bacterium]|nr:hypothetical protein [Miltoncostaeaceae bacterium]
MSIQPRRRPKHPPFTAVTLAALFVALVFAIIGLTAADGRITHGIWLVAICVTAVAAVPTVITGILDLRAMREGTRAARTVVVHAGIMIAAVSLVLIAAIRGLATGEGRIDGFDGGATIIAGLIAFGGAALGALAMHVRGAGVREETLRDEARGGRLATTGGDG